MYNEQNQDPQYVEGVEEENFGSDVGVENFGFFVNDREDPHPLNNICAFLTTLAASQGQPDVAVEMVKMMQTAAAISLMKTYGANLAVIRSDGTDIGEMVEASQYKGVKKQIPFSAGGYSLDHLTKKGPVYIEEGEDEVLFFANERKDDIEKTLDVQTPIPKVQKAFLLASLKVEYESVGSVTHGTRRLHSELVKYVNKTTPAFSPELLALLETKGLTGFPEVVKFEPLILSAGPKWDYTQKLCEERIEPFASSGMGGRAGAFGHMMHVFKALAIGTTNPDMDSSHLPYGLKESEIMSKILMVKKGKCDLFVPLKGMRLPVDVLGEAVKRESKYALVCFKNVSYQEMARFCTAATSLMMIPMGHFAQMKAIMAVSPTTKITFGVSGGALMGCYAKWSRSRLESFYLGIAPDYPKPLRCTGKFFGGKTMAPKYTCMCSPSYGNLTYYPEKDVVACQCSRLYGGNVTAHLIEDDRKVFGICTNDCDMHRYCPRNGFSCIASAYGISIGRDGNFQVCAPMVLEESTETDLDGETSAWLS